MEALCPSSPESSLSLSFDSSSQDSYDDRPIISLRRRLFQEASTSSSDDSDVEKLSSKLKAHSISRQKCYLLLGEGDFSFARALKERHPEYEIWATSLDSESELSQKYGKWEAIKKDLGKLGVHVRHNVDVFKFDEVAGLPHSFDRIRFNFPYTGRDGNTAKVVDKVFELARTYLKPKGRVVLGLVDNPTWDGIYSHEKASRHRRFSLRSRRTFPSENYKGYEHRKTHLDRTASSTEGRLLKYKFAKVDSDDSSFDSEDEFFHSSDRSDSEDDGRLAKSSSSTKKHPGKGRSKISHQERRLEELEGIYAKQYSLADVEDELSEGRTLLASLVLGKMEELITTLKRQTRSSKSYSAEQKRRTFKKLALESGWERVNELHQSGKYCKAEDLLKVVCEASPDEEHWELRSANFKKMGKLDKAEQCRELQAVETVKKLKPKARKSDVFSQFNLAWHLEQGLGTKKDPVKAFELYKAAADQGDADGQYAVGCCYEDSTGVGKDLTEAFRWYKKAAKQGHAKAQYFLARCYRKGIGTVKNYDKAFSWYKKAAKQQHSDAQYMVGWCYEYGKGVKKDPGKAFTWYKKAADQLDSDAQYAVGLCYEKGYGTPKDLDKARSYYEKAAKKSREARSRLKRLNKVS